MANMKLK
jgi:hypothetical protein